MLMLSMLSSSPYFILFYIVFFCPMSFCYQPYFRKFYCLREANQIKYLRKSNNLINFSNARNSGFEIAPSAKLEAEPKVRVYYPPPGSLKKSQYSPTKKLLRSKQKTLNPEEIIKAEYLYVDRNNSSKLNILPNKVNEMASAINFAKNGVIDAALQSFLNAAQSVKIKLIDCNNLIKILGDNGHLKQCDIILSTMNNKGIKPSIITYSILISRAGNWNKKQLAENYFHQMIDMGIVPDVQAYNCLINAYAKSGDTDLALKVLYDMERSKITPSVITFNTLLDSCARAGKISRAMEIFDMMKKKGFTPNCRSYSTIVHACCQAGNIEQAVSLVEHMEKENINPSEVTYSLLLNGLGQSGDLYRAFKILDSLKLKGIRPNVVTVSTLVNACGKHGQLDLAFLLYKEMAMSTRVEDHPNCITCSSLVDACLKAGQIDRAFEVVHDMRSWGLPLTEVTYTSLISELTRLGELDRIVEVVLGEPAEGIPPTAKLQNGNAFFPTSAKSIMIKSHSNSSDHSLGSSGNREESRDLSPWSTSLSAVSPEVAKELVRLLSRAERVDAALDVLEGIVSSQSLPPGETVELVVSAVKEAKELNRAAGLVRKVMQLCQDAPPPHYLQACELLLSAAGRADGLLRAYEVFASMQATSSSSSSSASSSSKESSYVALMEACREGEKHEAVVMLFESMKTEGVAPGAMTYRTLMQSMDEDCRRRSAEATTSKQLRGDELFRLYLVFQEMRIAGLQADAAAYNTLINACAAAGDLDRALETVRAMQDEGVAPNVITYTSLIKACGINGGLGTTEIAEEIFGSMQQRTNHFSTYIEPNEMTYQRLMQTHLRVSDDLSSRRVFELMEEMKERGLDPGLSGCRSCVRAAVHIGDVKKGLEFLDVIRKSTRIGYDYKSWQAVGSMCAAKGMVDVENSLREEIEEKRKFIREQDL